MRHPIGPFVSADRFNTLIGAIFLAIVSVAPDGPSPGASFRVSRGAEVAC